MKFESTVNKCRKLRWFYIFVNNKMRKQYSILYQINVGERICEEERYKIMTNNVSQFLQ